MITPAVSGRGRTMLVLLAALFLLFAGLLPGCASAEADPPYFVSAGSSSPDGTLPTDAVTLLRKKAGYFLFLPAAWDADRLTVRCEADEELYINDTLYHNGDTVSLPPGTSTVMAIGNQRWEVANVLQSAAIPTVFLTTDNPDTQIVDKDFSDKSVKEPGACRIVNADGTCEYDGRLAYVRIRGNSTRSMPKKPFQIKLDRKAPLFGMNSDKTWVLLANYIDKSLIRNTISMDLARYAGVYAYVPGTQAVDLFVNHQYAGSYLLTEKCEVDSGRLKITDLEALNEQLNLEPLSAFGPSEYAANEQKGLQLEQDPEDTTGGYLVLATLTTYYEKDSAGFVTHRGQPFLIDNPKNASEAEVAYISARFQQIEDALFAGGIDENGTPWTEWLDETTFVHRYLQAEVTGDYDGNYPYFYKDADPKDPMIYCGPIWDQDMTWGARKVYADPARFYVQNSGAAYAWFPAAMKLPEFAERVRQIYREVYLPALEILLGQRQDPTGTLRSLDEYAAEVAASAALENVRWQFTVYRPSNYGGTGDTPEETIAFLRDYISRRMAFLNAQWLEEK